MTVKKKILIAAAALCLLIPIGARVLALGGSAKIAGDAAQRPPLVPAARIVRGDVEEHLVLTGTIRARNAVEVHPEQPGRIDSVRARVGDRVRAGQILATIEHDEVAWQAKAAQAAAEVARANLTGARLEHARARELHEGGAAAPAQLDAARVRLALAEAQLAQAEAAAGLAEERVAKARIVSPIAGVVTRRPIDVGAQVGPQTAAFAVEDLSALKLESAVDAAEWARIALGAVAQVSVDALPGEAFRGSVVLRSPSLDPATRRAAIEIEIENGSGRLLPGAFAHAELAAGRVQGALLAPREAVVDAPGGAVLWRLAEGRAEAVKPRLGATDGRQVVVLDGLSEGDLVAIAGQALLGHGAPANLAEGIRTASAGAPAPGAN